MTNLTLALVALLATETAEPPAVVPGDGSERTIARLEEAIAATPDDPEPYAKLAKVLVRRERWDDASTVATRAAEQGPELAWTVGIRVFDALHSAGRFEDADGLLRLLRSESHSATRKAGWRTLDASKTDYAMARASLGAYLFFDPPADEAKIVYNAVLDRAFQEMAPSGRPPEASVKMPSGQSDFALPILLNKVSPDYPESLRSIRREGRTILSVVVREDGTIGRTEILATTHAEFSVAALDAVKRWKYKPARLADKPVAVYYTISVTFRLGKPKKGEREKK